jgi:PhzF family phenazine biosynthesis protein
MAHRIVQVDAFTDRAFAGNPAAVCLLEEAAPAGWMQEVAREMNLSETAFLLRSREPASYELCWFTPKVEVALCGHATLASAHVLWEEGHVRPEQQIRFLTRSGMLSAEFADGWIALDFPAEPAGQSEVPEGLAEALGVEPIWVGRNRFDLLAELSSEEAVRELTPDTYRLRRVSVRGVIVTARAATRGFDFVSRFFAPSVGVDEDPVTGSAHCCLGPYWSDVLGRTELTGWQASERGGLVRVHCRGERVTLSGQAVTTLRGELL